ncbi:MAG: hypothetical protein N3F07_02210 [Candidatus Micrarchaeota archaeon]|nr:hypothetical protein [Candidatus Micrarchaeota archaeon]
MDKRWLIGIGILVLLAIAVTAVLFFSGMGNYHSGMAEAYDRYYGTMSRYSAKYSAYLSTLTPIYQGSASKELQLYVNYRSVASFNESESTTVYRTINVTQFKPDLITRILLFFNKTEAQGKDQNLNYVLGEKIVGHGTNRAVFEEQDYQDIREKESTPTGTLELKQVTVRVYDDPLFKEDYNVVVNFDFNHEIMMAGNDPYLQVSGKTFVPLRLSRNSTSFAYIVPKSDWTNNITLSFRVRDFDAEEKSGGWQITQRDELNVTLSEFLSRAS